MPRPPSSEELTLAAGRHLRLVVRNGWEYVARRKASGIVVILALTGHGGLVLVTQWREPAGAWVVELPAGLAGDLPGQEAEELAAAARRELQEETGFTAATLEPVLSGPPSPGISSEIVTFFRARKLSRTGRGGGGAGERIRTHVVPLGRLEEWLAHVQQLGFQVDPKVLAGAWLVRKG